MTHDPTQYEYIYIYIFIQYMRIYIYIYTYIVYIYIYIYIHVYVNTDAIYIYIYRMYVHVYICIYFKECTTKYDPICHCNEPTRVLNVAHLQYIRVSLTLDSLNHPAVSNSQWNRRHFISKPADVNVPTCMILGLRTMDSSFK